jgi:hypothetical protein
MRRGIYNRVYKKPTTVPCPAIVTSLFSMHFSNIILNRDEYEY